MGFTCYCNKLFDSPVINHFSQCDRASRKERRSGKWARGSDFLEVRKCHPWSPFFLSSALSHVKLSYVHCSEQSAFSPSISARKYTAMHHGISVQKKSSFGVFSFSKSSVGHIWSCEEAEII